MHSADYDGLDAQVRACISTGSADVKDGLSKFESECTSVGNPKWSALRFYGIEKGCCELSLPVDVCCANRLLQGEVVIK